MPRMRRASGREVIRALEQMGFQQVRQRGSHVVMKKIIPDGTTVGCVVPMHHDLAIGTLLGILKQAMVDPDEFMRLL